MYRAPPVAARAEGKTRTLKTDPSQLRASGAAPGSGSRRRRPVRHTCHSMGVRSRFNSSVRVRNVMVRATMNQATRKATLIKSVA